MSILVAVSTTQSYFPMEVISQGGVLAAISLFVSLSIGMLTSDSKYWNEWTSSTLNACSSPFLITFAAIVAFKIMTIL